MCWFIMQTVSTNKVWALVNMSTQQSPCRFINRLNLVQWELTALILDGYDSIIKKPHNQKINYYQ